MEEDRWAKVRQIVREECERIENKILMALDAAGKTKTSKVGFKDGNFTGLDIKTLKEFYPAVDVEQQIREMRGYLVLNPSGHPKSNYGAFVHKWLTKHQNSASLRLIPTKRDETPGPSKKLCAYCDKVATGSVGSRWTCSEHVRNAMSNDPVPHMRGVEPKAVAGE